VAIVTGSARGIGEGIAVRFADEGANVVIADRKVKEGEAVAKKIKETGREAMFMKTDVSIEKDIINMISKTLNSYGKLDILVNNAGVSVSKPIEECTIEEYDFVHETDLRGLWLCCREAVKTMKKNGGGKIINIASTSGVIAPFPNQTIYCAAKGGVIQLTRSLAVEVIKYNINVNCIAPSFVDTPIYEELDWSLRDPKNLQTLTDIEPCGRIGTVEECAGAAFYLASDDSNYVLGQTIYVDGGLLAW
jgi:NAD(P)-dependent dehydrogenase (short-subunit alcohol dehydrogenase family)